MTLHADAIYEGGVLRPVAPLDLNEHEVVSLSISTVEDSSARNETEKQRAILTAFVAKMESMPDRTPQDGLSNRDRDKLIHRK